MVSEGSLKMKTFYLNAKCSVTDIFYPVDSSLTLKLFRNRMEFTLPPCLLWQRESVKRLWLLFLRVGKTKEGAEKGPGPRTPESVCVRA